MTIVDSIYCSLMIVLFYGFPLLLSIPIKAQSPTHIFSHITTSDGLPHHIPVDILQDKEGYLWISSTAGLIKYDGNTYTHFVHNPKDKNSISGDNIFSLFLDSNQNLWIGTYQNGLCMLNANRSIFTRFNEDSSPFYIKSKKIYFISEDNKGRIWIGGNKGIEVLVSYENGYSTTKPPISIDIQEKLHYCALKDPHSKLWVGGDGYVLEVLGDVYTIHNFKEGYGPVNDLELDKDQNLWISLDGNSSRLFFFNESVQKFEPQTYIPWKSKNRDIKFTFDKNNNLWLSEFGYGFQMYNMKDHELVINSLSNSNLEPELFTKDPFCDKNGNLWIGGYGLYKYGYHRGFKTFLHSQQESQVINDILYDDANLWLSVRSGGLLMHDLDKGTEILIKADPDNNGLYSNYITDILKINENELLLTTIDAIQIMDINTLTFTTYLNKGEHKSAIIDTHKNIWISGYYGLYLFKKGLGIIDTINLNEHLNKKAIRTMVATEDNENRIWFADRNLGLGVYSLTKKKVIEIPIKNDSLEFDYFDNDIEDMVFNPKENELWLATYKGLLKIDLSTMEFQVVSTKKGIEDIQFNSLLDVNEHIWAGTNTGLLRYNKNTKQFDHFQKDYGLINNHLYSQCAEKTDQGVLMFGGQNGIDFFNPSDLDESHIVSLPYCTSLSVNGQKRIVPSREELLSGLVFSAHENFIELTFSCDDLTNPASNKFFYKIEGIHNDWVALGSNPRITLGNLSGNNLMLLKVESTMSDGVDNIMRIPIVFRRFYYETFWFRSLLVALSAFILFFILKKRELKKIETSNEKAKIKAQIATLEKKALDAQMNPHFIFNSINAIQEFIYDGDDESAILYLSKFSKIIRAVLNFSSQVRIPLNEEIAFLKDYLEMQKMRFSSNFNYSFHIMNNLDIHSIEIPPFIIQPHIENAIEHGLMNMNQEEGLILVKMQQYENGYVKVVIEDNGIGIKASKKLKQLQKLDREESKGIKLVQQRLNYMKLDNEKVNMVFIDKAYEGKVRGTQVEITIPYD